VLRSHVAANAASIDAKEKPFSRVVEEAILEEIKKVAILEKAVADAQPPQPMHAVLGGP
jgi:hypothetical protein